VDPLEKPQAERGAGAVRAVVPLFFAKCPSAISQCTGLLTANARGVLAEMTLPSFQAPSGLYLLDCELVPLSALWTTARLL